MSRKRYYVVRSLQTVFMMWVMLTFLFFLFRLMPGNYTDLMLVQGASEASIEQFREKWGLDEPLYFQYWVYLKNLVLYLDAGNSLNTGEPVIEFIRMRLWNTAILFAPAVTVGYALGSVIGTVMGNNRGTKIDDYTTVPLIFISSFPSFFIAIVLVIVFAGILNIFPTSGLVSPTLPLEYKDAPWWRIYTTKDFLMHYTLPFSVIVLRYLALPALVMRTNIVEILEQNFIQFYRFVGLPKKRRLYHLSKHASLPLITLYPISMSRAIGGLVLVEAVFNWPGMGFALIQAILRRDFPVVQFTFFLIAAFVILANFAVDIVYGLIDPRVSLDE